MGERPIHAGHRARMREKFLADGGAHFEEHEILEMLLFSVIPRKDTNETAHRLIEAFGSLEKVLDASPEELCTVDGIRENTAVFLALVRETAKRYATAKLTLPEDPSPVFDTPEKIVSFLRPKYFGVNVERAYLLLFDNGMHLLDCRHLGDGEVSSILFSVRQIAEHAYRKRAARVVLAHNHPDGIAVPSGEDLNLTRQVAKALQLLEIPLLEHFIFSKYGYCAVLNRETAGEFVSAAAADPFQRQKKQEDHHEK